jgi:hypothetical protein
MCLKNMEKAIFKEVLEMVKTTQLKKMALVVTMAGLASSINAASDQGTATARVVTPLTVTESATTMDFGDVAPDSTVASTVVLTPGGGRTASGGTAEALPSGPGQAAVFNVTGENTQAYIVTFGNGSLDVAGGSANPMTVDTFTTNLPVVSGNYRGVIGTNDSFNVGATLNMAAGQPGGSYSTANGTNYTVTVIYE